VLVHEELRNDGAGSVVREQILVELDYTNSSWRKIRARRKIAPTAGI
jgi:hypothetical protein